MARTRKILYRAPKTEKQWYRFDLVRDEVSTDKEHKITWYADVREYFFKGGIHRNKVQEYLASHPRAYVDEREANIRHYIVKTTKIGEPRCKTIKIFSMDVVFDENENKFEAPGCGIMINRHNLPAIIEGLTKLKEELDKTEDVVKKRRKRKAP